jgi:formylglycine-generating enzyme required for sulfatase activity
MQVSRQYHVALSFAGEDRPYVDAVAHALQDAGVRVFYDHFEQITLWGKDLYEYLADVYTNKANFTVIFVSRAYLERNWTTHERKNIQARAFVENGEYILPAFFEEGLEVPGLTKTTGYILLKERSPEEFARLIVDKLRLAGVMDAVETPVATTDKPKKQSLAERTGIKAIVLGFLADYFKMRIRGLKETIAVAITGAIAGVVGMWWPGAQVDTPLDAEQVVQVEPPAGGQGTSGEGEQKPGTAATEPPGEVTSFETENPPRTPGATDTPTDSSEPPKEIVENEPPATGTPAEPPAAATRKEQTNSIGMQFVEIFAGTFEMGCIDGDNEECDRDERPRHRVTLTKPFYLGKHTVTQKQWVAVMDINPSLFRGADRPVDNVSWDDAQEFIRRLNEKEGTEKYRLPTEAEWEYSARAGTPMTWPWSCGEKLSCVKNIAWITGNSRDMTHPVGQKQPNPWGLYDMNGNVWEWVQDWYGAKYYEEGGVTSDPPGPDLGTDRVLRGGAWTSPTKHVRTAERLKGVPDSRNNAFGFRVAFFPGAVPE